MLDVERQKTEAVRLYENGYAQQQTADELFANADAARDMARKAVAKAEETLREANETLKTLRGINNGTIKLFLNILKQSNYCLQ